MPYCDQCGSNVGQADRFCAKCGKVQDGSPHPHAAHDFLGGISDRNMRILCYIPVIGWIACVVVLSSDRFRRDSRARFHAFQGLYLFVAWLFIDWVLSPFVGFSGRGINRLVTVSAQIAVIAGWIIMLTKTSNNEDYRLPIIGELADRSTHEQRM